jgi:hypothetical protein
MCKATITSFMHWIAKSKIWLTGRSPRILARFPIDFLLAVAIAIVLGVFPMTGGFKLFFLICLAAVVAELACRIPLPAQAKLVASALAVFATIAMGYGSVQDQFNTDAVFRDYRSTRNLLEKFQSRDESLKKIVAQYDRLDRAQSLFDSMMGATDQNQHSEINRQSVEDLKNALRNFDAIATPMGEGLRIKLGLNLYRVIYPVPMRMTPALAFTGLPVGVMGTVVEPSNLGFTVLFLPLSTPIDHFGLSASAEP